MAEEKAMVHETEVVVAPPAKMEFRLINPTEDDFLRTIKWNREELEAAVRSKVASYQNVVYTEDNLKQAKADRAELNKLTDAIEERRKRVKSIIMEPYTTFDAEVKEVLELIKEPTSLIDAQIKAFEDQQKEEKKKSIRESYDEEIGDLAAVFPFEKVFDSRYLNKTYKLSTAQADVKRKVEKVRTDLETIDSLDSKYKLNAKDVYIKTLDISKALAENKRLSDLEKKLEAEKRRKEEEAAKRMKEEEEQRRREEECRKAEMARRAEETRKEERRAEDARKTAEAATAAPLPFTSERNGDSVCEIQASVIKPVKNVSENPENVSKIPEGAQKPDESIIAPPAGDAAVTDPFASQKDTKQYKASFTIYGTMEQIMGVKQYMIDNNIRFGKVEK